MKGCYKILIFIMCNLRAENSLTNCPGYMHAGYKVSANVIMLQWAFGLSRCTCMGLCQGKIACFSMQHIIRQEKNIMRYAMKMESLPQCLEHMLPDMLRFMTKCSIVNN